MTDEIELLGCFADFAELSRNRPAGEDLHTELRVHSSKEHFHAYLQSLDVDRGGLPQQFRDRLARVLAHYGVTDWDRTPELEEAVFRIFLAQQRSAPEVQLATELLQRWIAEPPPREELAGPVRDLLERLVRSTQLRFPAVGDLARSTRFRWFDQPLVDAERSSVLAGVRDEVAALAADPDAPDRTARLEALAAIPEQIVRFLAERLETGVPEQEPMLEVLVRRHYREHDLHGLRSFVREGRTFAVADYVLDDRPTRVVSTVGTIAELARPGQRDGHGRRRRGRRPRGRSRGRCSTSTCYWPDVPEAPEQASEELARIVGALPFAHDVRRVAVAVCPGGGRPVNYFTYRPLADDGIVEDDLVRGVHPMVGRRLDLWRLRDFHVTRIDAPEDVLLYECVARENPADRRLVALAQVRQLAVVRDEEGRVTGLPHAERAVENCLEAIRRVRASRGAAGSKLDTNHVWVQVWPIVEADVEQLTALQGKITPLTDGAGIEEVLAQGRVIGPDGSPTPIAIRFHARPGAGVTASIEGPPTEPLKPLDEYAGKVVRARRRGLVYPYELAGVLTGPEGGFVEYDLDDTGALVPVDRSPGQNKAGILVAVVTTPTALHPEGVTRVVLCGDPTKALGAVSEPECSRIIAAIDLAERMQVPVEWYALSAGARISMDSGTENMDWVAAGLKRIIEFTQAGGEINVVVAGINVGAQPYWNAEATMLMHTKGILVMTPDSAMVLTGKQSLDFSGGVSAEDNFGIGGYDRVMGPNGQAQYWAPDLAGAFGVLMAHYDHTYVVPGESRPRRAPTTDPSGPRRLVVPARVRRQRLHHRRRDLLRGLQPGPQEGLRHPHRDAGPGRPGPPDAGALGRDGRRGHRRGPGRPPRRLPRVPARDRVAAGSTTGLPAHRRAGHLHRRHPVPALLEEGGPGDQRGQRQPSARRAGQPLRLRRFAGLDAQPPAGVRRGDRPRDRQLRRPDRLLRHLALPRRRVRGLLQGPEPEHDRARPRGVVRVGHRRCPGGGSRVRRRGREAYVGRLPRPRASRAGSPTPPDRTGAAWSSSSPT